MTDAKPVDDVKPEPVPAPTKAEAEAERLKAYKASEALRMGFQDEPLKVPDAK